MTRSSNENRNCNYVNSDLGTDSCALHSQGTKMKTPERIKKEIEALKTVRPNVRPASIFGDDNLTALDAQIAVLENDWDDNEIYDRYDHADSSEYILDAALAAREWMDDEEDDYCEGLACGWPLKE